MRFCSHNSPLRSLQNLTLSHPLTTDHGKTFGKKPLRHPETSCSWTLKRIEAHLACFDHALCFLECSRCQRTRLILCGRVKLPKFIV
jgi:hypothetical protein